MGLVKEGDKYAILTDIAGAEDHYGDMDFKVAGTRDGITGAPDGHQGAQRDHRRSCRKRWSRRGAAGCTSSTRWTRRSPSRAPNISQYAPRIYTMTHPDRQDPRPDRTGRQGDPRHHRADRREDRRRGRRHGAHRLGRRSLGHTRRCRSSATSPPRPRWARPTWARWCGWWISARSSRSSRAPTACCTSARSPRTASRDVRDELKEGDQILVKVLAHRRQQDQAQPQGRAARAAREAEGQVVERSEKTIQWAAGGNAGGFFCAYDESDSAGFARGCGGICRNSQSSHPR